MRKQPKREQLVTIVSEVKHDHYRIKNWIVREWFPIIGSDGLTLYNIYSQGANLERGNKWFFSLTTLEKFTGMARTTINLNNWLLEACRLIRIESGDSRYANEYVILDPPTVTAERLADLAEFIRQPADTGKVWNRFKTHAIERVEAWQPLEAYSSGQFSKPDFFTCPTCSSMQVIPQWQIKRDWPIKCGNCLKEHPCSKWQSPQTELPISTNGSKPEPAIAESVETKPATAESDELVQQLVEYFADNKPKLTKESAKKMILAYGAEKVQQQLEWLDQREIDDNPLKTLRASLKFDWLAPDDEPGELDEPIKTLFDDETRWIMPPTPLQEKWDRVQLFLKTQVISSTFNSLFQQTELVGIEGDVWIIQCESEQQQAWIEHRWMDVLFRSVASVTNEDIEIQFVVKEKVAWIPPSQRNL